MEWHPSLFFHPEGSPAPYALLILNQPINERAYEVLSEHASYVICADGGANRLYDLTKSQGRESKELPDIIVGDLDSLQPAVRTHYEKFGVSILKDSDQYSTDFTKCLNYLNAHASEIIANPRRSQLENAFQPSPNSLLDIVILGGLGGRVDQAFSQIHHLYMMAQAQRQLRQVNHIADEKDFYPDGDNKPQPGAGGGLYLVSEESMTFVLQQGRNIIFTPATRRADVEQADSAFYTQPQTSGAPQNGRLDGKYEAEYFFEENVGIIPLSAPASITTQGFEWNVQDWYTEIGGQISTSNHIRAEKVEVTTSVPVLFTVELAQRLKR